MDHIFFIKVDFAQTSARVYDFFLRMITLSLLIIHCCFLLILYMNHITFGDHSFFP